MRQVERSVVAVVVAYLVFAVSAYAFFRLSGHAPHQSASTPVMDAGLRVGMVFSLAGGYVAAWLAGRSPIAHAMAVASILALGVTVSLFSTLGKGGSGRRSPRSCSWHPARCWVAGYARAMRRAPGDLSNSIS